MENLLLGLKRVAIFFLIFIGHIGLSYGETSESSFSLKAGMLFEGEFYSDPPDAYFATDSGLMLQLNLETMLAEKMSAGVLYSRANTAVSNDDTVINTYGVTLKAHINPDKAIKIRPGIAIGYQTIEFDSSQSDNIKGLGIGAFIELLFSNIAGVDVVTELGFITQPAGGNEDIDLTFAPIMYLTGGINFGF